MLYRKGFCGNQLYFNQLLNYENKKTNDAAGITGVYAVC
jgi:hypothetical protein